MTVDEFPQASAVPQVQKLSFRDLTGALGAGMADFRSAPLHGLFFSAIYVLAGFLMVWLGAGHVVWVVATSLGFPLAAPFVAVGFYDVSRQIEAGAPVRWKGVLGTVWAERGRQIPWMGAIVVIYFLFWTFLAHMIFAMMMGYSSLTNISDGLPALMNTAGLRMIAVELVVGAAVAFLLFSITVTSIPLLLDKEIDFVTAMITSVSVVKTNPVVMLVWAAFIAVTTFLALMSWFLGLLLALPILGHATWHLYRRALKTKDMPKVGEPEIATTVAPAAIS